MVTTRSAARRVDPGPGRHQRHRSRKKRRVDDDDNNEAIDKVTCVILSKLPVRSLMRFKCVCKPWRLLVEKDPYFIDLHFTNSKTHPNFFTVIEKKPYAGTALLVTGGYLSSDEARGKAVVDIHNTREIDVPNLVRFFRPLDGLVGFYDSGNYNGIRLSNVCTQETTPWIKSTFLKKFKPEREIAARYANCQLGFDPASKRHKVICACAIVYQNYDLCRTSDIFCEVLTVGDHEWRRIAEDHEWRMIAEDHDWRRIAGRDYYLRVERSSVYLNGCIYYITFKFMRRGYHDNDKIVVFDVGSEKFRAITIPNFILYHPRDIDDYGIVLSISLSEMDGHLALFCRINGNIVKLWLYDDDFKKNNSWTEITIELPFVWDKYTRLSFHPVVGKNQIIIKSCACQNYAVEPGKICSLSYHSYDWMKKTFTEIKINGIPSAIGRLFKTCHSDAIFMESLFPVQ